MHDACARSDRTDEGALRVLFLADTHLGFDLPSRPRVARRLRGLDFFSSFERALQPALEGRVDLVIHGGDVFFRSKVGTGPVTRALEIIRSVTEKGVPFLVVPGNHERSKMPFRLLWSFPGLHLFDRPRSFRLALRGLRVVAAGFPYSRENLPRAFPRLVDATGWRQERADLRLLCIHHVVEGATVGPGDFTFRSGRDVIPGRLIPRTFAAVLSGHIHRSQILRHDLQRRSLGCPVIYPGSTQRTSFAEKDERKGHLLLELGPTANGRGEVRRSRFCPLPARPMVSIEIDVAGRTEVELEANLRRRLSALDPDSIVRLRLRGEGDGTAPQVLRAASLRALTPSTMNIDLVWRREMGRTPSPHITNPDTTADISCRTVAEPLRS